jgi:hypothetical protein
MPKITKIVHNSEKERYYIHVDGIYCTSVRERTFPAMKISVGSELTCDQVKELDNFHWKNVYGKKDKDGKSSWDREKIRLNKVCSLISDIDPRIEAEIVGFGANSIDVILEHPKESGKPDIEVHLRDTKAVLIFVEVTGTEVMRGDSYWIRPDKLAYAEAHPDQDVWIILHYATPSEKVVFVKPSPGKKYIPVPKVINGSTERYVEFWDKDDEVIEFEKFKNHLVMLVKIHTR